MNCGIFGNTLTLQRRMSRCELFSMTGFLIADFHFEKIEHNWSLVVSARTTYQMQRFCTVVERNLILLCCYGDAGTHAH